MSKVICIMGESGSGKTTSMRNLDPKSTYYIDADKKGLSWKGWRKQYNKENKNYLACDDANIVRQYIKRIAEACPGVKVIVVDTVNGLMVADEMRRSKEKGYLLWLLHRSGRIRMNQHISEISRLQKWHWKQRQIC